MKKAVDVVYCGLVRDLELFKKSILDLQNLRKEGLVDRIIFSTWKREIKKYLGLDIFLKKSNIDIIESEEPKTRGWGNIWCQMKSLDVGLDALKDKGFVFKTRADLYIEPKILKRLFLEKEELLKIKKNLPKGNIFKYKVWNHFYELKNPFMMGDVIFLGYKDDLKHLINYDMAYEEEYDIKKLDHGEHVMRFIHPFLKDYPILYNVLEKHAKRDPLVTFASLFSDKYINLRKIKFFNKLKDLKHFNIIKNRLKDENYMDILAAYYYILYSHFYVYNDIENPIAIGKFIGLKVVDIDAKDFSKNFTREKINEAGLDRTFVFDMELLENIFNKNIVKNELNDRLLRAIERFENVSQ